MKRRAKKLLAIVLAALTVGTTFPMQTVMAAGTDASQQATVTESSVAEQSSATESVTDGTVQGAELQGESVQADTTVTDGTTAQAGTTVTDEDVQTDNVAVQQADTQENTTTNAVTDNAGIGYVVVSEPTVALNETQNILVGIGEEGANIQNVVLNVSKDGVISQIPASKQDGNAFLFTKQYTQEEESGVYKLESVTFLLDGQEVTKNFAGAGFDVSYGVNQEVETNPDAVVTEESDNTDADLDIVTIDENGNTVSQDTIGDAIENAKSADGVDGSTKASNGNVVVVLDPGHDNTHAGARGNGLAEEDLNLKIAKYCRAELQTYQGVTVYMTRNDNGDCPYPGTSSTDCNANRVAFAQSVGASVYVSIHNNSSPSSSAHGAMVYYPNGNYNPTIGAQGQQLASIIEDKLVALGLANRGIQIRNSGDNTTYPDGSLADYYGVIRRSKLAGFPAIIVEHAFVSNAGDANNFLNSDAKLQQLGIADATGIAEYFGLSKSNLDLKGICYNYTNRGIDVGVDYGTTGSNIRFKWMAYDLDTQEWEGISDWYAGNWATWQPHTGNYWLQVQAITDEGYTASQTINFHVTQNYAPNSVKISGICYQYQQNGVNIGVGYESNDPGLKFRWLSYNLDEQRWSEISGWFGGNWATWKPKVGNYWLQAQVMNSLGQVWTYTICFANTNNYITEPLTMDGIAYVVNEDCINVGAAYTTLQSGIEFRWMAYNLQTQQWSNISGWSSANWTDWKPQPGNYWLHVEGRTKDGVVKDYTTCFAVDKDYTKKSLEISGICVVEEPIGINIGVAYQTKAASVNFKYSIYDLNKNTWTDISGWTGANWATWYPESGSYWIYVEAVTNEGVTANKCIGYVIDSRYAIMGSSSTTLSQMVNYYNANQAYPEFYRGSDAPTIQAFCQIYIQECQAEGVKVEVAFCQAMKETGFLRYGGDVSIGQYNFAGLGATGNGNPGESFGSVREGVRAQVQHLKAYASTDPLNNPCVDKRFDLVARGSAPYVEWLGIKENPYGKGWATAKNYGYSIKNDYMKKLFTY